MARTKGTFISKKNKAIYKEIWLENLPTSNGLDYICRRFLEQDPTFSHITIKWRYHVDVWMKEDIDFKKEVQQIKNDIKHTIENELIKKCYAGDFQAMKFFLERLYSDKYMEKTTQTIENNVNVNNPIEINIIKPEDKKE